MNYLAAHNGIHCCTLSEGAEQAYACSELGGFEAGT
jgi:hypothetical protein